MIGVYAALPAEARCLGGRCAGMAGHCLLIPPGLLLHVGGIGASAADHGAEKLITAGATALCSWGCAAGLAPDLEAGELLIPETIVTAAGRRYQADTDWRTGLLKSLATGRLKARTGVLADSAAVLESATDKNDLYRSTGAAATDMESAAVAACAERHARPFLCIRAIADTAAMQVPPELLAAVDEFGRPKVPALLLSILRQPGLIPELFRLQRAFGAANRTLRLVAHHAGATLGRG